MTTFNIQDRDDFATVHPGITFDTPDESWTIATAVLVSSSQNDGVFGSGNSQILANHGSIFAAVFGVELNGDHALVSNDEDAKIIAIGDGVFVDGNTVEVDSQGLITSLTRDGVTFGANSSHVVLNNSGTISGRDNGVLQTSQSNGDAIHNAGVITATTDGVTVVTADGVTTTIVNAAGGTIRGGVAAVRVDLGAIALDNRGAVIGNIDASLATGADLVLNHGSIHGAVFLGGGDDVFIGTGGGGVTVFGDQGDDRLVGGSAADTLFGGSGDDRLIGSGGADRLDGGLGNDTLTGGKGRDQFVFDTTLDPAANVDRITDFTVRVDKIMLGDRIFPGIGHGGVLPGALFHVGAGAQGGDDRIIYNPANGFLIYDANGNQHGGAVHLATLAPHLALSHADFLVYEMPM